MDIIAGQKVAIVGSSGCGKSTTVGLLERFYDPLEGFISLDNRNTKEYNIRWFRSLFGLVSQEPVLFDLSIKDNITFGLQEKPAESEIEEAAKKANIHSFIATLPQVYVNYIFIYTYLIGDGLEAVWTWFASGGGVAAAANWRRQQRFYGGSRLPPVWRRFVGRLAWAVRRSFGAGGLSVVWRLRFLGCLVTAVSRPFGGGSFSAV